MLKKGTFVFVQWEDIQSSGDWNEPPELGSASMESPGWVGGDVDKRFKDLYLAQSRSIDEETLHDHFTIPTGCISSIRELATGVELWDVGNPDKEEE